MKKIAGIWLPDADTHFAEYLGKSPVIHGAASYQWPKIAAALAACPRRGHAVDIGAHVGLWTRILSREFAAVTAFEPIPAHIECFEANLADRSNVVLEKIAIGSRNGGVRMQSASLNSGNARVRRGGDVSATMCTLDSVTMPAIDLLKIDVEGYELDVIRGGEGRIRQDRPVIIVEQKAGNAEQFGYDRTAAVDLLIEWGAQLLQEISGDYLLRFP